MKYTELNKVHFIGISIVAFLISNLPLLLFAQEEGWSTEEGYRENTSKPTTYTPNITIDNMSDFLKIATIDTIMLIDPETYEEYMEVVIKKKKKLQP